MSEIKLGNRLRDRVTRLEGIAIARVEYLNGCIQFCIQPEIDSDGFADAIRQDKFYIDQSQLVFVDEGFNEPIPERRSGGRMNSAPRGIGK